MFKGDASEIYALAVALGDVSAEVLPAVRGAIQKGAESTKSAWQENARATSGAHGKHYPNSITYETRILMGSVIGEVGPDSSKLQGSMGRGFEFGSRNQPPHLDGAKAIASNESATESHIARAIDPLFP